MRTPPNHADRALLYPVRRAIAGDRIADITELEGVRFVMKDGRVIRNELGH